MPNPVFGFERVTHLDHATLDEFATRHLVQHPDVATAMREDQGRFGRIIFAIPIRDQSRDCIVSGPGCSNHPLTLIGRERGRHVSSGEIERRIAHPLLALAIDGFQFRVADPLGNRPEGGTRFDRLELIGIADENKLRAR
ncbi:hypothetical protein D3C80_1296590 [compost metagenome]